MYTMVYESTIRKNETTPTGHSEGRDDHSKEVRETGSDTDEYDVTSRWNLENDT